MFVERAWHAYKFFEVWRRLTSGSTNRRIFGAAVTVALLTAVVKAAALIKDLLVAWSFGTGDALDAFLIAFIAPSFVINVVAVSFNAALIPTYICVSKQEGREAAQKLLSSATFWIFWLLGISTIVIIVAAPLYLPLMARGFSPEKLKQTFYLLCLMAPLAMLAGFAFIWGAVLNAGERFAMAALTPIVTPIVIVIFLLVDRSWGVYVLAGGFLGGAVLELVLLGTALRRQGISLRPRYDKYDSHLRQVASQYAPMIAGISLMSGVNLVNQSMAAMLAPGSVASLNYGSKIVAPLLGLSASLSTAVLPYFSRMVAMKDWPGLRHTLRRCLALIFAITIPVAVVLIIFSEKMVHSIFQRGAFTAENTVVVAQISSYYALQIPFHVAGWVLIRLISSMQRNQILMWVFASNLGVNILLNNIFMRWMGVAGIALSTACVNVLSFLFVLFFSYCMLRDMSRFGGYANDRKR